MDEILPLSLNKAFWQRFSLIDNRRIIYSSLTVVQKKWFLVLECSQLTVEAIEHNDCTWLRTMEHVVFWHLSFLKQNKRSVVMLWQVIRKRYWKVQKWYKNVQQVNNVHGSDKNCSSVADPSLIKRGALVDMYQIVSWKKKSWKSRIKVSLGQSFEELWKWRIFSLVFSWNFEELFTTNVCR